MTLWRDHFVRLGAFVIAATFVACGGDDGTGGNDTSQPTDTSTGDVTTSADADGTATTTTDATSPDGDATTTTTDATTTEDGDAATTTDATTTEDGDAATTTDATTTEDGDAATTTDATTTEDGDAATTTDGTTTTDGSGEVAEPCSSTPLEGGCECVGDGDCASGFCAIGADGSTCVDTCDDNDDCGGLTCLKASGSPDGVCVQPADLLCMPCAVDADCRAAGGTNRCIARGAAGSFCGTDCSGEGDCPDGFGCNAGQCVPDDNTCECTDIALELGAATACTTTNGFGTCSGQRICSPSGLTACNASTPAQDVCNGLDDDCSGTADDAANICNDNNPCTANVCSGNAGCTYPPQAGSCNDNDPCTSNDTCSNGECGGTPTCACQQDSECDSPPPGWDGECFTADCTAANVCVYTAKTGSCSDGDLCTTGDTCAAGICGGTDKDCDDDNDCTNDSCDPSDGLCDNDVRTGSCEDGDPCTTGDVCTGGVCGGTDLDCSSLDDACHVGVCDGSGSCVSQAVTCGVSGMRMHVPAAAFKAKGSGNTWFIGSAGQAGPVGRSTNGTHTIHFGFFPGLSR